MSTAAMPTHFTSFLNEKFQVFLEPKESSGTSPNFWLIPTERSESVTRQPPNPQALKMPSRPFCEKFVRRRTYGPRLRRSALSRQSLSCARRTSSQCGNLQRCTGASLWLRVGRHPLCRSAHRVEGFAIFGGPAPPLRGEQHGALVDATLFSAGHRRLAQQRRSRSLSAAQPCTQSIYSSTHRSATNSYRENCR